MKVGDLVLIGWQPDPIDEGIITAVSDDEFRVYWFGLKKTYMYDLDESDAVEIYSEC